MPHVGPKVEGHQAKIGRSRPNLVIFWPFLAFEGRLGGLTDPLGVRVEGETCRTIHGTHLEGILGQKNLTGLACPGHELIDRPTCVFFQGGWSSRAETVQNRGGIF